MTNGYLIFSLGDSAVTIDLGNYISEMLNRKVLAMQQWLYEHTFDGLKDILVGYSSVTILYDPVVIKKIYNPSHTVYNWVQEKLQNAYEHSGEGVHRNGNIVRIPVCYAEEYGTDLASVAAQKQIPLSAVIDIHTARTYKVYMIGFLPGFSYMGEVDEQIAVPRKHQPVPVIAGSVGVAGSQTGIYPLNCPGGWQIIGRTPVKLFDSNALQPVKLHAGDHVQFYSISREEFGSSN